MTNYKNIDEKSLEALLAAAFRLNLSSDISDKEAEIFFQQPARLSKEDREMIQSWGKNFIENIINRKKNNPTPLQSRIQINQELELECYAMNRDKNGNDLDEKTKQKIDEERKKVLEEENNKNNENKKS
jgi:hypothetical protein